MPGLSHQHVHGLATFIFVIKVTEGTPVLQNTEALSPCVTDQTEILPFLANAGDILKASRWAVSIWTLPSVLMNPCMQVFFT